MKISFKGVATLALAMSFLLPVSYGQTPSNVFSESGTRLPTTPIDDIVPRTLTTSRRVLAYDNPREADIAWQKRVEQVIDVRERMNLPFVYEQRPFLTILLDAVSKGVEDENSPLPPMRFFKDEKFTIEMGPDDLNGILYTVDTVSVTDPETYEVKQTIVRNELSPDDIKRFRVKEIWYFDKEAGVVKSRIIGFAPLKPIKAEGSNTNLGNGPLPETPMFWVYYPDAREYLARERVFNEMNDSAPMSWEDVFEMRFYNSYVFKASNVQDGRLKDFFPNAKDRLMESQKIKDEILNYEIDLWVY